MYRSIVVGTDGTATARRAVETAADLAGLSGAELHIVTAFAGQAPERTDPRRAAVTAHVAVEDEARERAMLTLARLADDLAGRGARLRTHWRAGRPADALLAVAERENADLLVVGNRGMRGARRVLGSVANDVSHRAGCSVLIVHTL